ncbi:YqaA family protein [Candidatus Hydrogenosomobacter endosymbioticus]|uniref:Cytochrome b561 n=1 Tax=Candidatus Hydrogenosomobacter endosymbioticus TaxID=2558174 RepID=A0ABN6L4D1_9PROT|nr:VTT domain-containing protein [Candidatus Hydrogenosomobacter endosymbioticus]BDB96462.1 cytochrome b561 [Candidatus Hydrogenosomobacter endosymbioticus]
MKSIGLRRLNVTQLASSQNAISALIAVVFLESWIFPIPPDPLYFAVVLHRRDKIWMLAYVCTVVSVLGGIVGYAIGMQLYDSLGLWILDLYNCRAQFVRFQEQFMEYGFWIILMKGLTPIPYKVVAIACGVMKFDIWSFILASVVSRGIRFVGASFMCWKYGEKMLGLIHKRGGLVMATFAFLIVAGFMVLKVFL